MQASPIISLTDVTKSFNGQVAVSNVTLSVAQGEIVGLLGQTGAGKSTILNLVLGQIEPTTGKVIVDGVDPFKDYYALRGKIGVSFQSDRLIPWRNVVENVGLGLEILRLPKHIRENRIAEWLGRVKLAELHRAKYPHQLSGGMRQRISFARALAIDPDVVLLDESFSQLDPVTSRELRAEFLALLKQFGKTCLFITHRIEDSLEMADRILVIAPPGRINLELSVSPEQRKDPLYLEQSAARISDAMAVSSP